jgi:hypothetical protein
VSLSYYVYYRVPRENFERALAAVAELQRAVAASTGITGRLMRRRDDETTWMEIYESVSDAASLEATLARLVRELGILALLAPGTSRKQEVFQPL